MSIYCGNNANHSSLRNRTKILGNRYTCLKKGFGVGFHSPIDIEYSNPYHPIDKTKKYCGLDRILPTSYDMFGSLPDCFRKGFGVGKKQSYKNSIRRIPRVSGSLKKSPTGRKRIILSKKRQKSPTGRNK